MQAASGTGTELIGGRFGLPLGLAVRVDLDADAGGNSDSDLGCGWEADCHEVIGMCSCMGFAVLHDIIRNTAKFCIQNIFSEGLM